MALRTATQTLLAQAARTSLRPAPAAAAAATSVAPLLPLFLTRKYHPTGTLASYKDDQDRQSLKPRRSEGTKSGSDDEVAEKTDAAFNPNKTAPEDAKESAERASNGSPLEVSGANQEFSKSPKPEEPEEGKAATKTKSAGSQGKKHGKVGTM